MRVYTAGCINQTVAYIIIDYDDIFSDVLNVCSPNATTPNCIAPNATTPNADYTQCNCSLGR